MANSTNASLNGVSLLPLIQTQPLRGSYGTKLDAIIRHLKYIQATNSNSNSKCIIFSQWEQVLDFLSLGLKENQIGFVKLGGSKKEKAKAVLQFRTDPTVQVFMLHTKSQSSGLTLVAATHVFIVEPIINPDLEQQGIFMVMFTDNFFNYTVVFTFFYFLLFFYM